MKIKERRHGETTRQYTYRTLRENIISLDLEPGAPFNDIEMPQMIGVSRTPVREAVVQSSEESRIIKVFPQRGMRTALTGVDLVGEARFLRPVLEKVVVELVYGQTDEEGLQQPDENIRFQEFYLEGGLSWKFLGSDSEMHRKSLSICHRELTYEMSQRLAIHHDRIRSLSMAAVKGHKIVEDHRGLLEAIWNRGKKLAAETMDLHLNR